MAESTGRAAGFARPLAPGAVPVLLNTIALDPNRWTAEKEPHFKLADLLPAVADAGFRALEVWQYHLSTLDAAGVEALAERAGALGVTFPVVGTYPVLDAEGEARQRAWAEAETVVRRAEHVGARAVKMFAGRLGSDEADAEAYSRSVAFTRSLVALAGDHGLGVTAETHPDTLCDSVAATRRFLDAVGDDRLSLCYQPFDFTSTERAVADYRALAGRVTHVHLQGRRDGRMVPLAEAEIDYRALLAALADGGFDGALSIEFVAGCVVERPADFDLGAVLAAAQRDRTFVEAVVQEPSRC